jgi:hypothetical protein
VETRGSALVPTPIGVRRVANLPDRWEEDELNGQRLDLC